MNWLTPEQAVEQAQLSLSADTLASYPNRSQQKITTEERFQKLGLLFDRERYKVGKPYLALLKEKQKVTEEIKSSTNDRTVNPSFPDAVPNTSCSNNSDSTLSETPEDNEPPLSSDFKDTAPYIFEKCTVKLAITFLPDDGSPLGREVILAASSHSEFPINKILRFQELGELPTPIAELIDELKADFPNRKIRRIFNEAKAKKKTKGNPPPSIQPAPHSTAQEVEKYQSGKQLTLLFS